MVEGCGHIPLSGPLARLSPEPVLDSFHEGHILPSFLRPVICFGMNLHVHVDLLRQYAIMISDLLGHASLYYALRVHATN
jgi:hypothetical protein